MRSLRNISWRAVAAAAALALAGPVAAHARDPVRAAETTLLGADHAAEHALLRELESDPAAREQLAQAERTARRVAASTAAAEPLDEVGRWGPVFDIPVFAINAAMLPTGKVLWFAYPYSPDFGPNLAHEGRAYLWDPAKGMGTGAFTPVPPPPDPDRGGKPVNLFCAGISFLADGQVLVTGGNLKYPAETGANYAGLKDIYTFDPWTETWTVQPEMNHGRWYPSQLLVPDGRTFIMGGLDEGGAGAKNEDLELFTPAAQRGGVGSVSLLGPAGLLGDPGRPPVGDYYPHLFWMPSGRALVAGPWTIDTWWLNRPGGFSWTDIDPFPSSRVWGSAVLVPAGPDGSHEVLQLGGSDKPAGGADAPATASTIRFDETLDNGIGEWMDDEPMNVARSHHNTVLLPDSTMVTVGGGIGSTVDEPHQYAVEPEHLQTELWNPATGEWRLGPAQHEFRTYHSTAVLLPDGRVVSAGDDYHGPSFTQDTAEIYEPPYLFDGDTPAPRPLIADAPAAITWGQAFGAAVTRAPCTDRAVNRAVLIAPSATTHAVDGNQRLVPLRTTSSGSGMIRVEAPPSRDVAPPGLYMLFVLDETGTPSVARWVRLADGPADPDPSSPGPTAPCPQPAQPSQPPAATVTKPTAKLPRVRARIVRRGHRRYVQLRVARSSAPRVRVRLRLLDRRDRVRRSRLVTVRTGRTTIVRSVRLSPRIRKVRATARSLRR